VKLLVCGCSGSLPLTTGLKQSFQPSNFAAMMVAIDWWHYRGATVVQEVEKSFSNQKVASSIPCRSVLEQDTEPLIAPDVQCAIGVKCVYIVSRTYVSRFGQKRLLND